MCLRNTHDVFMQAYHVFQPFDLWTSVASMAQHHSLSKYWLGRLAGHKEPWDYGYEVIPIQTRNRKFKIEIEIFIWLSDS